MMSHAPLTIHSGVFQEDEESESERDTSLAHRFLHKKDAAKRSDIVLGKYLLISLS